MKWIRFQPPRPGLVPSGIGRPAEVVRPASSSRRLPRFTSANAGAALVNNSKSTSLEGDGFDDVVDHVADADDLIVTHAWTSVFVV